MGSSTISPTKGSASINPFDKGFIQHTYRETLRSNNDGNQGIEIKKGSYTIGSKEEQHLSRTQEDIRDIFRLSHPLGKVYNEEVVFNTIGSSSPHELESMPRRIQSGIEQMKFVPG